MDLESVSRKQLNDLEISVTALLALMRKAKIRDEVLVTALKSLEHELGETRRKRFDAANPEYQGY